MKEVVLLFTVICKRKYGFINLASTLNYNETQMDLITANEASSQKPCLRISDQIFIGGFLLVMCYVVRCDLRGDVAGLFNTTYKMLRVDLIEPCNQLHYFQDDWFYVTYCLKVRYLPFIHSWDSGL